MVGSRFINTSRDPRKRSAAAELMRLELDKKGKLPPGERYKLLLKKKLAASKEKAMMSNPNGRRMSKRAEQALKEISARKAAKEAKALRRMVIVQPKIYHNGKLNAKGKITDIEGNIVAQVNTKNGKMATTGGWGLGKYRPASMRTHAAIMDAIDKYSPYYVKQRQMQQQTQGGSVHGAITQETLNVYGYSNNPNDQAQPLNLYGEASAGPRQNIGVTAWGAMADNPWGTFADNAWGTTADNVWGTASTNVWGGLGGNVFGGRAVQFWGTGNGTNYLKSVTNIVKAFFGISSKNGKEAFKASVRARSGGDAAARTSAVRTARVGRS
jgi:hypothetical protein